MTISSSAITETTEEEEIIDLIIGKMKVMMLENEGKTPLSSLYKISSTLEVTIGSDELGVTFKGTVLLNDLLHEVPKTSLYGIQAFDFVNIGKAIKAMIESIKNVVGKIVDKLQQIAVEIEEEIIEKINQSYAKFLRFLERHPYLASGGISASYDAPGPTIKVTISLKFEKK
ncbi:MAG: hypothetical protein ACXADH_13395 [Candidatus Kariarchaeaceae archaeon]|jgi:hypothetical protein